VARRADPHRAHRVARGECRRRGRRPVEALYGGPVERQRLRDREGRRRVAALVVLSR